MAALRTSDIISRLAYGELSNLKMAKDTPGMIEAISLPNVLIQLNEGLKHLFTRFLLSQKEVIINTEATITHYFLRYEYALSNEESLQPVRYIDDSACDGFDGRIGKILSVFDGFGRQVYMNKAQEPLSVFTPQHDCVQITANHQTEQFYVIFQALHPILEFDTDAGKDSLINIPPALEQPLIYLIASKIYGQMNGKDNIAKSAMLHQMFEAKLLESEFRDSASTSENMSNSKLERAGFI